MPILVGLGFLVSFVNKTLCDISDYVKLKRQEAEMQNSFQEAIGKAVLQTAHEEHYQEQHPEAVQFLKVTTIKGFLGVVNQVYRLLDHDSVELAEGVTLKVGKKLRVNMERNEHVEFSFEPAPRVRAKVAGMFNVNAGLEGIELYRNELKLILDGLPDVRIGLE